MKKPQNAFASDASSPILEDLGRRLKRLRLARRLVQGEAAVRAGIARSTASRIEGGDPSVAIGQIVRYLDAIAPGRTLAQLYRETDVAEQMLAREERRQRARGLSQAERDELDF